MAAAPARVNPAVQALEELALGQWAFEQRRPFHFLTAARVLELLLVLTAARLVGGLFTRLGHPSTVGELLAGLGFAALTLALGSSVTFLESLPDSRALHGIADVAIFFIILNAAVELEPREIAEHSRESFAVAIGGMLVPLAAGFAFAWAPPGRAAGTAAVIWSASPWPSQRSPCWSRC